MRLADSIADLASRIPDVRSETAFFVQMDGSRAVVEFGVNRVSLPCQGWYPPAAGMAVQVDWRDGRGIVSGPARVLSPVGEITGTGSPKATVNVEGVDYLLYLRGGYTAELGDIVTVNWATGIIEGKVSGQDEPAPPPPPAPVQPTEFRDLVVMPENSGRFQTSWWGREPWASNNNDGIWTYGSRIRDALRGAEVRSIEINLILQQQLGNASVGLHPHPGIPGGAPSINNLVGLSQRSGWVRLPDWWGNHLRDNDGGIGVTAPGGGYNRWQSVALDSWSGALRFSGVR